MNIVEKQAFMRCVIQSFKFMHVQSALVTYLFFMIGTFVCLVVGEMWIVRSTNTLWLMAHIKKLIRESFQIISKFCP